MKKQVISLNSELFFNKTAKAVNSWSADEVDRLVGIYTRQASAQGLPEAIRVPRSVQLMVVWIERTVFKFHGAIKTAQGAVCISRDSRKSQQSLSILDWF